MSSYTKRNLRRKIKIPSHARACARVLYKYIIPVINESIAANKEITKNLTLINERIGNIERDMDNVKTDVINIKNDVNDLKNQIHKG